MDQPTTTTRGGLRGLLDQLAVLHAAGETALLGIVVATEGSTYQKPGALVLLDRHGLRHGVISGGCLEPELEQRAAAVLAGGRAAVTEFDTRSDEDLVFGSGTGCRGRVRLLLLPQPPQAPLAEALRHCTHGGAALVLQLALEGDAVGCGSARVETTEVPPQWHWNATGGAAPAACGGDPLRSLRIPSPPRVLLLGAGAETPPLLQAMQRFGWFTTIVEHRNRWLAFARSDRSDRIIDAGPGAALAQLAGEASHAAVIMSHNFALDQQYLRYCATRDLDYVGLLGPPARRDALLGELGEAADGLRGRLFAPVGLDLGGSGPEAIALAIVAGLQRHFARVRGG